MLSEYSDKDVIIFQGQVNFDLINECFSEYNFSNYTIILVDCSEETMYRRLIKKRARPELATPEMNYWREILLKQAKTYKEHIIDTDKLNKRQSVKTFKKILEGKGVIVR